MAKTFITTRTLKIEECCSCHMLFAITQEFMQEKRDDHQLFYCPAGHSQYYFGKSEKEKLQKQLSAAQHEANQLGHEWAQEREAHETTRRQRNALKGHLKKTKTRIGHGVCPCCNRTFKNLARHMEGQHPAYSGA